MRLLIVLLAIAVVAAGCASADPPASAKASSSVSAAPDSADTATLVGTLTDDAALPIAGVEVALVDVPGHPELQAQTDAEGRFTFAGLPAGEFRLIGQKLGYESLARMVLLVAGETTEVTVTMVPIQLVEVFHVTKMISGIMSCIVTVLVPLDPGYTSYACGDTAQGNNLNANNKMYLSWEVPVGPAMHVAEMFWESQSSMSDQLRFQMSSKFVCSAVVCENLPGYQTAGGPPPVAHRVDAKGLKDYGKGPYHIEGRFTGGPVSQTSPVRVIIDQKFDVYLTDWFGEEAPEAWTATPPK